ncbi:hypothetical protein ACFV2Q_34065 [Streptomyces sp. NPDC059650]|uniref:hypothetical protein n=1 Tax=Streptomyces sp. NPDC059650 TaxID=3346896 RepID=UPI00369E55B2
MPSSAHRRVVAVLLAAVLAVFCDVAGAVSSGAGSAVGVAAFAGAAGAPGAPGASAAPARSGAAGVSGDPAAPGAPEVRERPVGVPGVSVPVAVAGGGERGPRCAPGPAAPDRAPAVPARAGTHLDHALAACARPALPGAAAPRCAAGPPCGARGPDRPAPGPVELSVMRV